MKKTCVAVLCWCVIVLSLPGCGGKAVSNDVEFAKSAIGLLAKGDLSVEEMIDWNNFQAMGFNVGTSYSAMPNDTAKASFRKSFISSFSASFQKTGATAESLSNWRVLSQDSSKTIVVADTIKKTTFSFTVVKRDGKQKISAMNQ